MGEPEEALEGTLDSEGNDPELLRGLEAALARQDDADDNGVDSAVPGLFESHGSLSEHQGGFAESSAAQAATPHNPAEVAPAREVRRLPLSTPRVELPNKSSRASMIKDPTGYEETPERRVSARVGSSPMPTNLRAEFSAVGSSDDRLHNAGGAPAIVQDKSVLVANLPSALGLTAAPVLTTPLRPPVPQADANSLAEIHGIVARVQAQNQELQTCSESLNIQMHEMKTQLLHAQSESLSALKHELEMRLQLASDNTESAIHQASVAQRVDIDDHARALNFHTLAIEEIKQSQERVIQQMGALDASARQERERESPYARAALQSPS